MTIKEEIKKAGLETICDYCPQIEKCEKNYFECFEEWQQAIKEFGRLARKL